MPAQLERTRTPGVYKRGSRYVVIYRDADGVQRKQAAVSYNAAKEIKRDHDAAAALGIGAGGSTALSTYTLEWVERYQGRGQRGFRDVTRDQYRHDLKEYVIPYFGGRTVAQITPREVANFVGWLCDSQAQGERAAEQRRAQLTMAGRHEEAERVTAKPITLADATVRRILAPLRSCLGTAMREGLIRSNPTAGASLPARDAIRAAESGDDDEPDRRALSRGELAEVLRLAPERHRALFQLLASTGLRISEALALRWQDVRLDGSRPVVRVRRAYVKGRFGPPKSKHGRRDVPLSHATVLELRRARKATEWPEDVYLVFCAHDGRPLHAQNLSTRVLKPIAEEANVPWCGWHTFRHTCASLLFAEGRNPVQVSRWLGHHSPGFTLATYAHLLDDELGEPLELEGWQQSGNMSPPEAANDEDPLSAEIADLRGNL